MRVFQCFVNIFVEEKLTAGRRLAAKPLPVTAAIGYHAQFGQKNGSLISWDGGFPGT